MKKKASTDIDPLDREIDFSNMRTNPHFIAYHGAKYVRVIDKDLADVFPDDISMNAALRSAASETARPNPYARDYAKSRNLRVLAPDLLEVFPDSESVNEALRTLVRLTAAMPRRVSAKTATARRKAAKKVHS